MTIVPETCMGKASREQRTAAGQGLMHWQATSRSWLAHCGGIQRRRVCQQGQDADNCDHQNEHPPSMQVPAWERPGWSALQHWNQQLAGSSQAQTQRGETQRGET